MLQFLTVETGVAQLSFSVQPVFKNEALVLNARSYITTNGDTLTIETFKFYLGNFSIYSNGKWQNLNHDYLLVDAESPQANGFTLASFPAGKMDSISFIVGTDSLANVSGALEGALDPSLGMYWAWNTGYIYAKLEGKSKACKTFHHAYEFHIGGYLRPYNAVRKVTLSVKDQNKILLLADAAEWFTGTIEIKLSLLNSVVTPSKNAMLIADNYKNMFRVK